ncbi:uncharacterized protein RBU33_019322 isoform 1-T1 [Hipposideros larvatus]
MLELDRSLRGSPRLQAAQIHPATHARLRTGLKAELSLIERRRSASHPRSPGSHVLAPQPSPSKEPSRSQEQPRCHTMSQKWPREACCQHCSQHPGGRGVSCQTRQPQTGIRVTLEL